MVEPRPAPPEPSAEKRPHHRKTICNMPKIRPPPPPSKPQNKTLQQANMAWCADDDAEMNDEFFDEVEEAEEFEKEMQMDNDEGLGEHYALSKWVPPKLDIAHKHGRTNMFSEGKAVWGETTALDLGQLGAGLTGYFLLLKQLVFTFGLMSLVVIPIIAANAAGSRTPKEFIDPANMLSTSMINAGNMTLTKCFSGKHDAACAEEISRLTVYVFGWTITMPHFTALTIGADVLCVIIFVLSFVWFEIRTMSTARKAQSSHIQVNDYAIAVTELPPDVTRREILDHFNSRYGLADEKAGKYDAHIDTVSDLSYTRKKVYGHKWIAQVSLAYDNTNSLTHLIKTKKLEESIMLYRGRVKMYSSGSIYANKKKRDVAMKKLTVLDAAFKEEQAYFHSKKDLDCHTVCAFVVFNNVMSQERCLADYRSSTFPLMRRCQPVHLRLRGTVPIKVVRAPDPTDILWENLGVKKGRAMLGRLFSTIMLILLLTVSFVSCTVAYNSFRKISKDLMDNDCPLIRANYYAHNNTNRPSSMLEDDIPPFVSERSMDNSCPLGMMHIGLAKNAKPACVNQQHVCACGCSKKYESLDISSKASADRSCGGTGPGPFVCRDQGSPSQINFNCQEGTVFSPEGARQCYCVQLFRGVLNTLGVVEGTKQFVTMHSDECSDVVFFYGAAKSVVFGSVAAVSILNVVIQVSAAVLVRFEDHPDVSFSTDSQTSKTFLGLFVNTVFVLLFANTRNFGGEFVGFEASWYPKVGLSVFLTVVVDCFAPHVAPLVAYLLWQPGKIARARSSARGKPIGGHPIATQNQMNEMHDGVEFELPVRLATILNTLGTVLCYSGALPMLIPLACLSFSLSYLLDKFFIIKLYKKPPRYQLSMLSTVKTILPAFVILHLVFSIWMFTEPTMYPTMKFNELMFYLGLGETDISTSSVEQVRDAAVSTADLDVLSGFMARANQGHVLPLFVLLAITLSIQLVDFVFNYVVPISAIHSFLSAFPTIVGCYKCCKRGRQRNTKPPFSGLYSIPVPEEVSTDDEKEQLTSLERAIGFELRYINGVLSKVKTETNQRDGSKTFLRTWEVIRNSTGAYSYDIKSNPTYGAHL